ncbi:hypothetical protein MRU69_04480 [Kocuria flava]|uniref:hypothetical protein n=1 Tax=Kocuria flava TaxID=446860 RepID=UPI001FF67D83|nr:hypothetical protein [Kocuria flava]MCJ8504123.1 hypothetical protein [Kocuria flava]
MRPVGLAASVRRAVELRRAAVLVDLRQMSPEFRVTPAVRWALAGALGLAALLAGSAVVVVASAGGRVLALVGDPSELLPALVRLVAVAGVVHIVLSTGGRSARGLSAPVDGRILGHAGYGRREVYVVREVLPAVLSGAGFLLAGGALVLLGVHAWSVPGAVLRPELLLLVLSVTGAVALRIGATAWLSVWRAPDHRRTVAVCVLAAVAGVATGLLARTWAGGVPDAASLSRAVLSWVVSERSTLALLLAGAAMLLAGLAAAAVAARHPLETPLGVDDALRPRPRVGIPHRPWWALVLLPLCSVRDRGRSDAVDAVIGWRVAGAAGLFGAGLAATGRTGLELPAEMATGLVLGAPFAAAVATYGVTSPAAHRGALRVLTASPMGAVPVLTAIAAGGAVAAAIGSWAVVPLVWAAGSAGFAQLLALWAAALVLAPAVVHVADCLLPGQQHVSAVRLRPTPWQSIAAALLFGPAAAGAWWWVRAGLPAGALVLLALCLSLLLVASVRPRPGGSR